MNAYITVAFLAICIFFLNESDVSCKSRGGGGRGGGSRGGSSRSGYRSGSSGTRIGSSAKSRNIMTSSRYNSWSIRVGVRSDTRYRSSPWSYQHRAIVSGYIIMSPHQRSRFHMSDSSYYDRISICYNEEALYSRNVTASPWYMCPWDDPSERYCCGDEVEERCCRYFERIGHKAGLIIGIIMLVVLSLIITLWWKSNHKKVDKDGIVVYSPEFKEDVGTAEGTTLLIYPPVPIDDSLPYAINPAPIYNNTEYTGYPPQTNTNAPYPCDPATNQPYPGAMNVGPPYPTAMDNSAPYPPNPSSMDNTLPYSCNPAPGTGYPGNMTEQSNPSAPTNTYDHQQMPPTYDDVIRNKM